MSPSLIVSIDYTTFEITLEHAVKYKVSVWRDLKELKALSKAGHEIVWSENVRWCVANGKTFNVTKSVYTKRVIDSELEDVFTDYHTFGEDGRHEIQVLYDHNGSDYEVLFDSRYDDFDKLLSLLK